MIFCYFELRGCSREEAIHTEIIFIEAYLSKRAETSNRSGDHSDKYSDKFQTKVKQRNVAGDATHTEHSGTISSDTLMKDKGMRDGLQGLIDRFSDGMKD